MCIKKNVVQKVQCSLMTIRLKTLYFCLQFSRNVSRKFSCFSAELLVKIEVTKDSLELSKESKSIIIKKNQSVKITWFTRGFGVAWTKKVWVEIIRAKILVWSRNSIICLFNWNYKLNQNFRWSYKKVSGIFFLLYDQLTLSKIQLK